MKRYKEEAERSEFFILGVGYTRVASSTRRQLFSRLNIPSIHWWGNCWVTDPAGQGAD